MALSFRLIFKLFKKCSIEENIDRKMCRLLIFLMKQEFLCIWLCWHPLLRCDLQIKEECEVVKVVPVLRRFKAALQI